MQRSSFLKLTGAAIMGTAVVPKMWAQTYTEFQQFKELGKHKIVKCELMKLDFHFPRFVGKNGRVDFSGQYKKCTVLILYTDQGAMGWGLTNSKAAELFPLIHGKYVSELVIPGKGIIQGLDKRVDFALHDLMG